MEKVSLYPKTSRLSNKKRLFTITEKLDGSNLCIFKHNNELMFAQRNTLLNMEDIKANAKLFYKGLVGWIEENLDQLNTIREGSVLCGEWIGMGKIGYSGSDIDDRFYMFAKANLDLEHGWKLKNIIYKTDLFMYCFEEQVIPPCIKQVPVIMDNVEDVNIEFLDDLYDEVKGNLDRDIEGFIVYDTTTNGILKYVRHKDGHEGEFLTGHGKLNNKLFLCSNGVNEFVYGAKNLDAVNNELHVPYFKVSHPIEVTEINIHEAIRLAKLHDKTYINELRDSRVLNQVIVRIK